MRAKTVIPVSLTIAFLLFGLLFWKFTRSPEYIIMTGGSLEKRAVIKFIHKKPKWRAVRMLRRLLEDDIPEVRLLAAGCAGEYGYNELTCALALMSESDPDISVRGQCLHRAVQLKSADSEKLIRNGLSDNNIDIKLTAIECIPLLNAPAPSLFLPYLENTDSRLRDKALSTAVRLKTAEAVPILARDLEKEELFELPDLLDALQNITGVNKGIDPEEWIGWYRENRK